MTESEGEFRDMGPPDKSEMLLGRQTTIERAHEMAKNAEAQLNEMLADFDGEEEDRQAIIQSVMEQLRFMCGHIDMPIIVNGHAWENYGDASTLDGMYDSDDPDTHEKGYMNIVKREHFNLEDRLLISLGYAAVQASTDDPNQFVIRHVAGSLPKQISNPNQPVALGAQSTFEIPIDGADTSVKLHGEVLPADVGMLKTFVPELMEQTEEIIDSGKSLQKKLRRLSDIDLNEYSILQEEDWGDLKNEYLKFLNEQLQPEMLSSGLYKVSGFSDMGLMTMGRVVQVRIDNPKDALRTPLMRLRYDPVSEKADNKLKLAVSGMGYVKGHDWNEITFKLSKELKIKRDSVIEVDGLPSPALGSILSFLFGGAMMEEDGDDEDYDDDDDDDDTLF